jgi:hypothetical protein
MFCLFGAASETATQCTARKRGKAGKTTRVQSEGATHRNAVTEHKTKEYTIAAPILMTGEAMKNGLHIRFLEQISLPDEHKITRSRLSSGENDCGMMLDPKKC